MLVLRNHQQRILDAMDSNIKGQIHVPTGGGKTICFIQDFLRFITTNKATCTVVVAPRILLAQQLCSEYAEFIQHQSIKDVHILHVHSGESTYAHSTKVETIQLHNGVAIASGEHQLIFTTYHSLPRIVDSGINVDTIYFDEAHNGCAKSHFVSVAAMSMIARRCYFFTATPRVSNKHDRGMNCTEVWGSVLESVPAPELIASGSIIPPTIVPFTTQHTVDKQNPHIVHSNTVQDIIDNLDESDAAKVLVAVPSSKVLGNILGHTDLIYQLTQRGYDVLHVTSKFGAYVNQTKVNREKFFETLTSWGKDDSKKFILFHYSILSEGINVPGLTHCILLRNLNIVEMAQTIGRVIRLNKHDAKDIASGAIPAGALGLYRKPTGYITVPVHTNYGTPVIKRLQRVVDEIFIKGVAATALV